MPSARLGFLAKVHAHLMADQFPLAGGEGNW
jgi:hypothetical protein